MSKKEDSPFEGFLQNVHNGTTAGGAKEPPANSQTNTDIDKQASKDNVKIEEPIRRKRKSPLGYQEQFFVRVDFTHRKPLYITASTHRRLMRIVHLMDSSKATISSYVENILLNHLDAYKEDINTIYQENNTNPTDI